MREGSTSPLLSQLCSTGARVLLAVFLVACGGAQQAGATTVDNAGLAAAIAEGRSGAEVTFDAVVQSAPVDGGGHERFKVTAPDGTVLEVDHNNSLAPEVPLHPGDHVVIRGRLYIDPGPRLGVHCTHAHTSSGCPDPGFIQLGATLYQ